MAEAATGAVQITGPALFTFALSGGQAAGWLLVGMLFLLAAAPALTGWAVRTRQHPSPRAARPCC